MLIIYFTLPGIFSLRVLFEKDLADGKVIGRVPGRFSLEEKIDLPVIVSENPGVSTLGRIPWLEEARR